MDEKNFLWDHFKFTAEQRIKTFNFFVVFSTFANGGILAALERNAQPVVFVIIGMFVMTLAMVFWMVDERSRQLVKLAVPGLKEEEKRLPSHSHLFAMDTSRQSKLVGYTSAFRTLFVLQLCFGLGALSYGFINW